MSETDNLRALMEADRWIDRVTAQRNHLPEMAELVTVEEESTPSTIDNQVCSVAFDAASSADLHDFLRW